MNKIELHRYVENNQNNICQIAALKNGKTVYGDCWHGFNASDTLHIMSATKSVVSLLVGIAIDKGLISGTDSYVLDYFPSYVIKRGEKTIQKVRLKHLLTMTAPYKYKSEPWTRVCTNDDWTVAALDLLGGRNALTGEFNYSTLGVHILTGIITQTSGLSTVEFANKYLFEPLGIAPFKNFEAKTAQEHKAFILSKQPKTNIWFCDPRGVATAGYGLCMSANDMAKIGQTCLDLGVYGSRRIVSAEWIRQSTAPVIQADERFANMRYGYMWWTPDAHSPVYAALGNSGNVIYVNSEKSTVVTVTGTFKPTVLDRVQFIKSYIEPMLEQA